MTGRTRLLAATAVLATAFGISAGAASLPAGSQVLRGSFVTDDQVVSDMVTVTAGSTLTIFSDSYGGGTNLDGTVTPAGGFEPLLTLFSPTGAFIDSAGGDGVGTPLIKRDPSTGLYGDAVLSFKNLAAGTYTLDITQNINYPNGLTASDGFSQAGTGNYTGGICGVTGSFLQSDTPSGACVQRTSAYSVNVSDTVTAAPEPASVAVVLAGVVGLVSLRRRAR